MLMCWWSSSFSRVLHRIRLVHTCQTLFVMASLQMIPLSKEQVSRAGSHTSHRFSDLCEHQTLKKTTHLQQQVIPERLRVLSCRFDLRLVGRCVVCVWLGEGCFRRLFYYAADCVAQLPLGVEP